MGICDPTIEYLTKDLEKRGPVSEASVKQFLADLDFTPPADYLQFIITAQKGQLMKAIYKSCR